jgi:hypothetical protein
MKKSFTLKSWIALVLTMLLTNSINAQSTVTKSVPGDYPTVQAALLAQVDATLATASELASGDTYIINVAEGIFNAPINNNVLSWPNKKLTVVIQGAGADKTFQRSADATLTQRIALGVAGTRWLQIGGAAGDLNSGSSLTIKDMTFQYLGTESTNQAAGAGLNLIADLQMDVLIENVVYDNIVGQVIVNNPRGGTNLTIENCLFKENLATTRGSTNSTRGVLAKDAGTLTIRNTTFYSNEIRDLESNLNGYILYANTNATRGLDMNVILENNAFVNNKNIVAEFESVSPILSLSPSIDATSFNVTMKNNILIGNIRSGKVNDVDLHVSNVDKVTWVETSGNILNKSLKSYYDEVAMARVFEAYSFDGAKIDPTYTYTDPRIAFTMEGDLPALTPDANAIGGVTYTGDGGVVGITKNASTSIKAYVYNRTMVVDGLKSGDLVDVYTILGSLYKRSVATANRLEAELPTGLYIVRSGSFTQKLMVK